MRSNAGVASTWRSVQGICSISVDADPAKDDAYRAVLESAVARLRKRMPAYWERTKAGIESILAHAAERGVKLGIENREKFEELPLDADFPEYLKSLSVPGVAGYWHDTGHAHIKQQMGVDGVRHIH